MKPDKRLITLMLIMLALSIAALEMPQYWPMERADCYTYFASIACVSVASDAPTLPPTLAPSPTATRPPSPLPTSTPSPTSAPPVVALVNGGMELDDGGNPAGWEKVIWSSFADWKREQSPPGDPLAAHSGAGSARFISHYVCWRAGLAQAIPAPSGYTVRISAWFLTMGSGISGLHNADPNMNSEIGIGVDKYGVGDAGSSDVVWSYAPGENLTGPLIGGNWEPVWTYHALTVRVPSDSQRMTVYISADLGRTREGKCNWALPQTLAFMDDVAIEIVP